MKTIANNDIDDTWKTVKTNRSNNVNKKVNNRIFNSVDVSSKYQPIFIHENEVTEPHINNRMNTDGDEYKNAFNSNIDDNVKEDLHQSHINFWREIHLVFLNKVKIITESISVRYKYSKGHKKKRI